MKGTTKLAMIACAIIFAAVGIFAVMASQSTTTGTQVPEPSGVQVPEKVSDEERACTSQTPTLINGVPEDGLYTWDEQYKVCLYVPPGDPPAPLP